MNYQRLNALTHPELRRIVETAVIARDRAYRDFRASAYLSGHVASERKAAIRLIADALDRYGL